MNKWLNRRRGMPVIRVRFEGISGREFKVILSDGAESARFS
jgi:hypothetical protein